MNDRESLMQLALADQNEKQTIQKMEQVRRQGYKFIVIYFEGPGSPPRLHSVEDMIPYEELDQTTGTKVLKVKQSCKNIDFKQDISGRWRADILDTPANRQFIANHKNTKTVEIPHEYKNSRGEIEESVDIQTIKDWSLVIDDEKVNKEIEALIGTSYDVEPSREIQIEREIERLKKEQEELKGKSKKKIEVPMNTEETGLPAIPIRKRRAKRKINVSTVEEQLTKA